MAWTTKIISGIRWLLLKASLLVVISIAAIGLYHRIFEPAIKHGWNLTNIWAATLNLLTFLGLTVAYLLCFYISAWIFTGSERDRGGKCPTTRYYIIFGIWTLIYVVALAKYVV